MIRALIRDAMRLLLRPIPLVSLVVVGALLGSLVAAMRHSLHGELAGLDSRGASLQSLTSGLALFVACSALVFGLLLGHEDRASGLISQLAIRPVSRFRYALGRGLGLATSVGLATMLLVCATIIFSGIGPRDVPELKSIVRAESVSVGGRTLSSGDVTRIARGEEARFAFAKAGAFTGELRIEVQLHERAGDGSDFTGFLDLAIRSVVDGKVVGESILERVKPVGSVTYGFSGSDSDRAEVVVENRTPGASLVITHDHFRATGPLSSFALQSTMACLLLFASAAVVALLGLVCSTAFSIGPAALVGGFLLLVGLAKSTVGDLAQASYPRFAPLLRLAPDLARFDASESFGRGEALSFQIVCGALGAASLWFLGSIVIAALALSWRDRT